MFFYIVLTLPVYEVPAKRVNTTKSTYTFTSVNLYRQLLDLPGGYMIQSATVPSYMVSTLLGEVITFVITVRKKENIRNPYNQILHITQETICFYWY